MVWGTWIRDPGSGKTYPGSRGKKGIGSKIGSATLPVGIVYKFKPNRNVFCSSFKRTVVT
jgi:hypothetical protein